MNNEIELDAVRMSISGIATLYPRSEHIEVVMSGHRSWTVENVIKLLAAGQKFFVQDRCGDKAYVAAVHQGLRGPSYIRTCADGTMHDNLLALPGGPFYGGAKNRLATLSRGI
ncbi:MULTISPECIES: DUF3892 domain-containing protein [unclassified Janthinobacterium]|uniref:DUF3892 domain-containing protein n=1 Tax=unclassified Janthinobacterium TaxID=2610881 RepID=UPI0012F795E3|nr:MULTISPECIES: DUF3892 domain-containing protein [unclassified Janthinobacterium]MEC5159774.1 hypothetical protein [Janthinobacterium sp. CG_S6]